MTKKREHETTRPESSAALSEDDLEDGDLGPEAAEAFLARLSPGARRRLESIALRDDRTPLAGAAAPASKNTLATIYYLGGRCYAVGDPNSEPLLVSHEEHKLLTAFETKRRPLDRAELEGKDHAVLNAPRVVTRLTTRYGGAFAPAVRRPGRKSNGGYFANVRLVE